MLKKSTFIHFMIVHGDKRLHFISCTIIPKSRHIFCTILFGNSFFCSILNVHVWIFYHVPTKLNHIKGHDSVLVYKWNYMKNLEFSQFKMSKSSGSGFASFKRAVGGGGNKVNDEKSSGKYF